MSKIPATNSLLAKSTNGATLLVLLRIGSRLTTFTLNQVLLRFLAPEVLGISTQLDLFSTSILSFACESLRVALQRQRQGQGPEPLDGGSNGQRGKETKYLEKQDADSFGRRAQETVNLSYIAIALGVPLAYALATIYLKSADPVVLNAPFFNEALHGYIIATILELLNEPCFSIAQQQMLYTTRASAEASATFSKCIVTCCMVIWASRTRTQLGVLPFAFGQLAYALVLNANYLSKVITLAFENDFSIGLRSLPSSSQLYLSRFSKPMVNLAGNLYGQSVLKQLLTNGDSYLIASFTSLSAQGSYALAANYGGLIARILFQPIEESSRSYLARLFASEDTSARDIDKADGKESATIPRHNSASAKASQYLTTLLRGYILFSIFIVTLGPTLSPLALRTIAGVRWANTEAPAVLAAYCYYIPLLAVNGILEAFVSATASPAQLRSQSAFMVAFSASFVASGYYVLKVLQRSGRGLVLASSVSMVLRILYSSRYVTNFLAKRGSSLKLRELTPGITTILGSLVSAITLTQVEKSFDKGWMDIVKWAAVAGGFGMIV